jgi:hypothetical protein
VRSLLVERKFYCPVPSELNDPYDCNIGTANHLMGMIKKCGVFCLSGNKGDDILLFSFYADKHKGFSLEFEVDIDKTIGETSFLGFIQPVTYVNDFPIFDSKNIHKVLTTKYRAWQYEDEYRVFADLETNPSKYRTYSEGELIGVRFGLHMDPKDESLVGDWVNMGNHRKVSFKKAHLCKDRFGLEYIPV